MFCEKGDPTGSFFVGIKIKEMSVFKKYGSGENLVGVMRFLTVLHTCLAFLNEVKNPGRGCRY